MTETPAVLTAFRAWLPAMRPELEPDEAVDAIRTLLELKANRLGSPSPTLWNEQLLRALLLQEHPRRVVSTPEDRLLIVPRLKAFLEFLMSERLWDSASVKPSAARTVLRELEFAAVEAADDPSRRSMSGNIMHFGVSQGLDFSDPSHADLLFGWYNSLTHAERIEISDTGALSHPPSRPFPKPGEDRGAGVGARPVQDSPAPSAAPSPFPARAPQHLWFLPPAKGPMPCEVSDEQWARQLEEDLETLPFVAAVRAIARLLSTGPVQLTTTDALRLKDCHAVLEEIADVYSGPGNRFPLRSMWDERLLEAAWVAMWQEGLIQVQKHRGRLTRGVKPSEGEWLKDVVHSAVIEWAYPDEDRPEADASVETLTALAVMHQNGELVLPSLNQARDRFCARPSAEPPLEVRQLEDVYWDLLRLHWIGLLEKEEGTLWDSP